MTSGGAGAWRSLRYAGGDAEAQQPNGAGLLLPENGLHENVGGLEILMNEPTRVQTRKRRRKRDGDAQEIRRIQRFRKQAIEELPARVGEHQHGAATLTHDLQRLNGPFRSKFVAQAKLMFELPETLRCRVIRRKGPHEDRSPIRLPLPPIEDELGILPHHIQLPPGG